MQQDNDDDLEYGAVVSPRASLTPYPQFINTIRLGLSSIYWNQAICTPYCNYMPGRKLIPIPMYQENLILFPDFIPSTNYMADEHQSIPGLNLAISCVHEYDANI